jgi:predicted nucleic acid-binding protein
VKLLLDTNIVLDVLMDKAPFSDPAADIFSRIEQGSISGYLCGTTITTVHYLAAKVLGASRARQEVGKLLALFEVAAVNRPVLEAALRSQFADFEDAVVHEAANHAGADAIVTRNGKVFSGSRLPVYTPAEIAALLAQTNR